MGKLKIIWLFILAACMCNKVLAVGDTTVQLTLQKQITGSFTDFYTDGLNNIYLIDQDNQIKKIDGNFDSAAVYNDVRRYGDIYSMDVSNALKQLVYYKDFSTILVLDRFLSPRNTVDLRSSGIQQVTAVATSYDNNYWVFDELDSKIKKVDDNGNVLLESADFRVLFSDAFNPSTIIDNDGLLYLYDIKTGWLVFDYYGALKQKVQLPGWKDVQVENKNLLGRDDEYLYISYPAALSIQKVKPNINLAKVIKIQKRGNKFLVLTKEALKIYTLP